MIGFCVCDCNEFEIKPLGKEYLFPGQLVVECTSCKLKYPASRHDRKVYLEATEKIKDVLADLDERDYENAHGFHCARNDIKVTATRDMGPYEYTLKVKYRFSYFDTLMRATLQGEEKELIYKVWDVEDETKD